MIANRKAGERGWPGKGFLAESRTLFPIERCKRPTSLLR
jgi:hypothetical protein